MAVDDSIKAIVLQRAGWLSLYRLRQGLPPHQALKNNSCDIKKIYYCTVT